MRFQLTRPGVQYRVWFMSVYAGTLYIATQNPYPGGIATLGQGGRPTEEVAYGLPLDVNLLPGMSVAHQGMAATGRVPKQFAFRSANMLYVLDNAAPESGQIFEWARPGGAGTNWTLARAVVVSAKAGLFTMAGKNQSTGPGGAMEWVVFVASRRAILAWSALTDTVRLSYYADGSIDQYVYGLAASPYVLPTNLCAPPTTPTPSPLVTATPSNTRTPSGTRPPSASASAASPTSTSTAGPGRPRTFMREGDFLVFQAGAPDPLFADETAIPPLEVLTNTILWVDASGAVISTFDVDFLMTADPYYCNIAPLAEFGDGRLAWMPDGRSLVVSCKNAAANTVAYASTGAPLASGIIARFSLSEGGMTAATFSRASAVAMATGDLAPAPGDYVYAASTRDVNSLGGGLHLFPQNLDPGFLIDSGYRISTVRGDYGYAKRFSGVQMFNGSLYGLASDAPGMGVYRYNDPGTAAPQRAATATMIIDLNRKVPGFALDISPAPVSPTHFVVESEISMWIAFSFTPTPIYYFVTDATPANNGTWRVTASWNLPPRTPAPAWYVHHLALGSNSSGFPLLYVTLSNLNGGSSVYTLDPVASRWTELLWMDCCGARFRSAVPLPPINLRATPAPSTTATSTASVTASGSASSSVSASVSASRSESASPGLESPSISPSGSASGSPSASGSGSPTMSSSPSASLTPSGSGSAAASVSPTGTGSGTASGSFSVTPSGSSSASPSVSAGGSSSPTGSASGSLSASATVTGTGSSAPTGSPSPSVSHSGSPSLSGSASASLSGSTSLSGSATHSVSASGSASGSVSPAASPSASASGSPTASTSKSGGASNSPSQSIAPSPSQSPSSSASDSTSPSISSSVSVTPSGSASSTASHSVSGSSSQSPSPSATPTISSSGTSTGTSTGTAAATASLTLGVSASGTGTFSATATDTATATGTGSQTPTGSSSGSASLSPSVSPSGAFAAASVSPSMAASASSTQTVAASLSGTATPSLTSVPTPLCPRTSYKALAFFAFTLRPAVLLAPLFNASMMAANDSNGTSSASSGGPRLESASAAVLCLLRHALILAALGEDASAAVAHDRAGLLNVTLTGAEEAALPASGGTVGSGAGSGAVMRSLSSWLVDAMNGLSDDSCTPYTEAARLSGSGSGTQRQLTRSAAAAHRFAGRKGSAAASDHDAQLSADSLSSFSSLRMLSLLDGGWSSAAAMHQPQATVAAGVMTFDSILAPETRQSPAMQWPPADMQSPVQQSAQDPIDLGLSRRTALAAASAPPPGAGRGYTPLDFSIGSGGSATVAVRVTDEHGSVFAAEAERRNRLGGATSADGRVFHGAAPTAARRQHDFTAAATDTGVARSSMHQRQVAAASAGEGSSRSWRERLAALWRQRDDRHLQAATGASAAPVPGCSSTGGAGGSGSSALLRVLRQLQASSGSGSSGAQAVSVAVVHFNVSITETVVGDGVDTACVGVPSPSADPVDPAARRLARHLQDAGSSGSASPAPAAPARASILLSRLRDFHASVTNSSLFNASAVLDDTRKPLSQRYFALALRTGAAASPGGIDALAGAVVGSGGDFCVADEAFVAPDDGTGGTAVKKPTSRLLMAAGVAAAIGLGVIALVALIVGLIWCRYKRMLKALKRHDDAAAAAAAAKVAPGVSASADAIAAAGAGKDGDVELSPLLTESGSSTAAETTPATDGDEMNEEEEAEAEVLAATTELLEKEAVPVPKAADPEALQDASAAILDLVLDAAEAAKHAPPPPPGTHAPSLLTPELLAKATALLEESNLSHEVAAATAATALAAAIDVVTSIAGLPGGSGRNSAAFNDVTASDDGSGMTAEGGEEEDEPAPLDVEVVEVAVSVEDGATGEAALPEGVEPMGGAAPMGAGAGGLRTRSGHTVERTRSGAQHGGVTSIKTESRKHSFQPTAMATPERSGRNTATSIAATALPRQVLHAIVSSTIQATVFEIERLVGAGGGAALEPSAATTSAAASGAAGGTPNASDASAAAGADAPAADGSSDSPAAGAPAQRRTSAVVLGGESVADGAATAADDGVVPAGAVKMASAGTGAGAGSQAKGKDKDEDKGSRAFQPTTVRRVAASKRRGTVAVSSPSEARPGTAGSARAGGLDISAASLSAIRDIGKNIAARAMEAAAAAAAAARASEAVGASGSGSSRRHTVHTGSARYLDISPADRSLLSSAKAASGTDPAGAAKPAPRAVPAVKRAEVGAAVAGAVSFAAGRAATARGKLRTRRAAGAAGAPGTGLGSASPSGRMPLKRSGPAGAGAHGLLGADSEAKAGGMPRPSAAAGPGGLANPLLAADAAGKGGLRTASRNSRAPDAAGTPANAPPAGPPVVPPFKAFLAYYLGPAVAAVLAPCGARPRWLEQSSSLEAQLAVIDALQRAQMISAPVAEQQRSVVRARAARAARAAGGGGRLDEQSAKQLRQFVPGRRKMRATTRRVLDASDLAASGAGVGVGGDGDGAISFSHGDTEAASSARNGRKSNKGGAGSDSESDADDGHAKAAVGLRASGSRRSLISMGISMLPLGGGGGRSGVSGNNRRTSFAPQADTSGLGSSPASSGANSSRKSMIAGITLGGPSVLSSAARGALSLNDEYGDDGGGIRFTGRGGTSVVSPLYAGGKPAAEPAAGTGDATASSQALKVGGLTRRPSTRNASGPGAGTGAGAGAAADGGVELSLLSSSTGSIGAASTLRHGASSNRMAIPLAASSANAASGSVAARSSRGLGLLGGIKDLAARSSRRLFGDGGSGGDGGNGGNGVSVGNPAAGITGSAAGDSKAHAGSSTAGSGSGIGSSLPAPRPAPARAAPAPPSLIRPAPAVAPKAGRLSTAAGMLAPLRAAGLAALAVGGGSGPSAGSGHGHAASGRPNLSSISEGPPAPPSPPAPAAAAAAAAGSFAATVAPPPLPPPAAGGGGRPPQRNARASLAAGPLLLMSPLQSTGAAAGAVTASQPPGVRPSRASLVASGINGLANLGQGIGQGLGLLALPPPLHGAAGAAAGRGSFDSGGGAFGDHFGGGDDNVSVVANPVLPPLLGQPAAPLPPQQRAARPSGIAPALALAAASLQAGRAGAAATAAAASESSAARSSRPSRASIAAASVAPLPPPPVPPPHSRTTANANGSGASSVTAERLRSAPGDDTTDDGDGWGHDEGDRDRAADAADARISNASHLVVSAPASDVTARTDSGAASAAAAVVPAPAHPPASAAGAAAQEADDGWGAEDSDRDGDDDDDDGWGADPPAVVARRSLAGPTSALAAALTAALQPVAASRAADAAAAAGAAGESEGSDEELTGINERDDSW